MLQTAVSSAGAATFYGGYKRFNSGYDVILNELYWTKMPWGAGSVDNTLYESHLLYGNSQQIAYPRLSNEFEYTDAARSRGFIRTVDAVLTADETLLVRAEAEIHLKKYTEALNDMNLWINAHCAPNVEKNGVVTATRPTLTLQSVNDFLATVPWYQKRSQINRTLALRKHCTHKASQLTRRRRTYFISCYRCDV